MDIYILRDGAQTGPFSEETLQRLLRQNSVAVSDLAWWQGAPEWIPLQEALDLIHKPAPAAPTPPAPPADSADVTSSDSAKSTDPGRIPATAKQKALLTYMGVVVSSDLGKQEAASLVSDIMENPKDAVRFTRWNEDRLRLHPDLFAAEIQAKRENRPNRFFDLTRSVGADCISDLSKAHCQVLVGYLDVKFPNWDARESEAIWNYFLPAVSEKFPDLVNRDWRGKLKYPSGPRVASDLKDRASEGVVRRQAHSPIWGLVKGLAIGGATLAVVAGGIVIFNRSSGLIAKAKASLASATATPSASTSKGPSTTPSPDAKPQTPAPAEANPAIPAPVSPAATELTTPGTPAPGAEAIPAMAAADGTPAATATNSAPTTAPAPVNNSLDALFNPSATPSATGTPASTAPTAVQPAANQRKVSITLTKPVEVPVPFGKALLPPGTQLKLVSQEGAMVKVNYLDRVVQVPLASTDLGADAQ